MPNFQVQTLTIPQPTVKVEVDYYNAAEKEKLLEYPTAPQIQVLVSNGIEIPIEEFLTYYLFHRKRPGKPGWQDYDQIAQKIARAHAYLSEWIDFNGIFYFLPNRRQPSWA